MKRLRLILALFLPLLFLAPLGTVTAQPAPRSQAVILSIFVMLLVLGLAISDWPPFL